MTQSWNPGDRVNTPLGPGRVAYVRMAPPDYSTPAAVSVVLDHKRALPSYTGTIFPADKVSPPLTAAREEDRAAREQDARLADLVAFFYPRTTRK